MLVVYLADWFHGLGPERIDVGLTNLRLSSPNQGDYRGSGSLTWNRRRGVEIRAVTDTCPEPFDGAQGYGVAELIPASHFLTLHAETFTGQSVRIDGLWPPHPSQAQIGRQGSAWKFVESGRGGALRFSIGPVTDEGELIRIVLSNGHELSWPRRSPTNEQCLETYTDFGKVTACARPRGELAVTIAASAKQIVSRVAAAVAVGFSFCTGRHLPIIATEARIDDSTWCSFPASAGRHDGGWSMPPLGGEQCKPATCAILEPLLSRAINFFGGDTSDKFESLLVTDLSAARLPFSAGYLLSCAVLERLAKCVWKASNPKPQITEDQLSRVRECLERERLATDLVNRVMGSFSRINEISGANAVSEFCKAGAHGFDSDDWDAWKDRNKPAHGEFSLFGPTFLERAEAVKRRNRIRNMINKLFLHAMDYSGLYFDYGAGKIAMFPNPGPASDDGQPG
jgi:hypothetical protein